MSDLFAEESEEIDGFHYTIFYFIYFFFSLKYDISRFQFTLHYLQIYFPTSSRTFLSYTHYTKDVCVYYIIIMYLQFSKETFFLYYSRHICNRIIPLLPRPRLFSRTFTYTYSSGSSSNFSSTLHENGGTWKDVKERSKNLR